MISRYLAAKMKRTVARYAMPDARGCSHDRRLEKKEW
tara:strand:+ start:189 stop:299 length:111 start_codon:yes stop_codon:yes gene_type:complete